MDIIPGVGRGQGWWKTRNLRSRGTKTEYIRKENGSRSTRQQIAVLALPFASGRQE
ncbi:MAG: hypothetical protein AAF693_20670 [Bacteroidota bacterium]